MPFDAEAFDYTTVDPLTLTEPRQRLEFMRDFLRTLPARLFDMSEPVVCATEDGRGSPGCVGGWLVEKFQQPKGQDIRNVGVALLGLTWDQASDLMFPARFHMGDGDNPYRANPNDAADVIDHLLKTGDVDWSVARS